MADRNEDRLFDAVVRPHRSLGPRGFLAFMLLLSGLSFVTGMAFLLIGAWPVFGFFGLDVALVYMAFRVSYHSGRAWEEISLTREELLIRRFAPNGQVTAEIRLNPYWARLEGTRDHEGRLTRLRLASHGTRYTLCEALGPAEREGFAAALGQALAGARNG